MREVAIIGIGQTPVGEHWTTGIRHLALEAALNALHDAHVDKVDAVYVGNMLAGEITGQAHLGALIVDFMGQSGIEAMRIEAACASGSAALRVGQMAVASGMVDIALVLGVEKMTDTSGRQTAAMLALAADAEYEASQGLSFVALNALLMRRYMYEFGWQRQDFANFAINAHANGQHNPNAPAQYAHALSPAPVKIRASTVGTAPLAIHSRKDPMTLTASVIAARKAYQQANIQPGDIDFFELHDAFTIMAALSLEAAGFAEKGQGIRLALEGDITREGKLPICTLGGLKARGHPVGATGIYQIVESVLQLRGLAGLNQIPNARLGMVQNMGGSGATSITHILEALE